MRITRFALLSFLLLPLLYSCDKTLNVNADWKDVTVVYGLLDQTKDTTYIKITKAFLGEGNALQFAQIPDSSNYPDKLEVRLDEYAGSTFVKSYPCDTVTIHNKQAGDSIFYYPDQLMYFSLLKLNPDHLYKLFIKNKTTGKEITAQTGLLRDFEVIRPNGTASFPAGKSFEIKWRPTPNGKRYQLVVKFFYLESLRSNADSLYMKSIDWPVFSRSVDETSTQIIDIYYPCDPFYANVGAKIDSSYLIDHRVAHHCEFIFTVASPELNTYMEVSKPSTSLIQEKPSYTNIINGIGLFSSRYLKSVDSLAISQLTKDELKVNSHTKYLGF
jgi:hypothetical protein